MKLTYRGHAYDISTANPINRPANSSQPTPVKLIYRGQSYYATPRSSAAEAEATSALGSVVTLIYRGTTYQRTIPSLQSYRPTGAINWRYQAG